MAVHPNSIIQPIFTRGGYTYSYPINFPEEQKNCEKTIRIRKPIKNRRLWWRKFSS